MTAEVTFWVSVAMIGYSYVGYPVLLLFISLFINRRVGAAEFCPYVSILIAAYNEEKDIEAKL